MKRFAWLVFGIQMCGLSLASVESHLGTIEKFAHGKRIAGGVMLTGMAAGFGLGSYLASRSEYASTRSTGAIVLGVTAGIFAAGGVPSFFLPADFERLPKKFREERLSEAEGERLLLQLRDQARTHRLIGSSLALAFGLGELVTFIATDRTPEYQWLAYSGAALTGLGSFSLFFFRSVPEKEWEAYAAEKWKVSLLPLPEGALSMLAISF